MIVICSERIVFHAVGFASRRESFNCCLGRMTLSVSRSDRLWRGGILKLSSYGGRSREELVLEC